jgi:alkanesulfonate monooxygenase SsuD/methylene tetrahydromethanopterin reductase-like flavin-dependent oxidoreductase (luciferase family)
MVSITLRYDMRRAPGSAPHSALYPAMIEQARWADEQGFTTISLSEHHVTDDGYMPSPLVVGAAVAAATTRIPITIAAIVAPLWDPIRLAEDLATLDNLAGPGRLIVTFAIGYREFEYEVLGERYDRRGKRIDEVIGVLRQAWTGEPFEYNGHTVRVQPSPATPGGPMLVMGGSTTVAARRAARHGMGMIPSHFDPEIEAAYAEECERLGTSPVFISRPTGPNFVHISNDPERDWARIGHLALHDATQFAAWQPGDYQSMTESRASAIDELRAEGVYRIITPQETIDLLRSMPAEDQGLILHPLMGGIDPEWSWESLQLLQHEVLPHVGA